MGSTMTSAEYPNHRLSMHSIQDRFDKDMNGKINEADRAAIERLVALLEEEGASIEGINMDSIKPARTPSGIGRTAVEFEITGRIEQPRE